MNFFSNDTEKIGKDYEKAVNAAVGDYKGSMLPHANAGAGLVNDGQLTYGASQASAALPGQQMDVLGQVQNYLDPSLNFQMQAANDQLASQYGSRGSLFSGAAGNAIADNTRQMAETGWGQAWDRAMSDNNRINNLGQQQFQNQMDIDQFNNDANAQNFGQQFGINQQNFSNYNDIYGTAFNTAVNAAGTRAETAANATTFYDLFTPGASAGAQAYSAYKGGGLS